MSGLQQLLPATAPPGVFALVLGAAFLLLNSLRILVYLPQLATCLRDPAGCAGINLWTWGMWVVANAVTGLYLWVYFHDAGGCLLQLGNSGMCAAIFGISAVRRARARRGEGRLSGRTATPAPRGNGDRRRARARRRGRAW